MPRPSNGGIGRKLLKRLSDAKTLDGAPHLTELVQCIVKEFGGAEAVAKELKDQYQDAPKAYKLGFLRMLTKLVEVNTEMGGADGDLSQATDEDIEIELKRVMRGGQGLRYGIE